MTRILRTAHIPMPKGRTYDRTMLLEARENGFTQIGVGAENRWYKDEEGLATIERMGRDAQALGMTLSILTCYQRQSPNALADHPEWRMVFEDGSVGWEACPFWEEYRDIYIAAMQRVARAPGVEEIQLNDEAHLTDWGNHYGCYCERCTALFRAETGQEPPREIDWSSDLWRTWIRWRFTNWVRVMREIAEAVRQANPDVRLSSQFDPAVCLRGWSPWYSGVDIAALADVMDLLRVDPYHTFHPHDFRPDVTYITEHVRYLRGALGGKPLRVWTQDFVWPEFSRSLGEADGRWTAALPVALGAEACTPYAYPLMQEVPELAAAYEDSIRWDRYYAEVAPVRHVAVVQGWQTKTWFLTDMRAGKATYDVEYFRPACSALRRANVAYDHLWDRRLTPDNLAGYKALVLPRVACLSAAQAEALAAFRGGLVATTDTGVCDEEGRPAARQALEGLVRIGDWRDVGGLCLREPQHPLFAQAADEVRVAGMALPMRAKGVEVEAAAGAQVLATFADAAGNDTGLPAIVAREADGKRQVYLAFEPLQARTWDAALISRRALAALLGGLFTGAARWAAGGEAAVGLVEPCSPGVEFILGASADESQYVVTLGNYYLEEGAVTLSIPEQVTFAYDAEARRALAIEAGEGGARVRVPLGRRPLKVVVLRR